MHSSRTASNSSERHTCRDWHHRNFRWWSQCCYNTVSWCCMHHKNSTWNAHTAITKNSTASPHKCKKQSLKKTFLKLNTLLKCKYINHIFSTGTFSQATLHHKITGLSSTKRLLLNTCWLSFFPFLVYQNLYQLVFTITTLVFQQNLVTNTQPWFDFF